MDAIQAHILIVDDQADNLELLTDIFRVQGRFQVTAVQDAQQVMEQLHREPADVVLLDVMMPDLDGLTLCRQIKADPALARIPVIFVSSAGNPREKLAGFDAGAVDYITKPFRVGEVVARVEVHIATYRHQRQIEALLLREAERSLALSREITERQRAEAELRASEERYRSLLEHAPVAILVISLETLQLLYINPAALTLFKADTLGADGFTQWLASLTPEQRDMAQYGLKVLEQGRPAPPLQYRFALQSGEMISIESHAIPIRYGEQQAIMAIAIDQTARRKLEEALWENQRFIEQVTHTMPDYLYVYEVESARTIFTNRSLIRGLGYDPERVGASGLDGLLRLMHPADTVRYLRHRQHFLGTADGDIQEGEYRLRHADGVWRTFNMRETVFRRAEDGQPQQILCIVEDITERKHIEESRAAQQMLIDALRDTVAQELTQSPHMEDVQQTILQNAGRLLPGSAANLMLLEPDGTLQMILPSGDQLNQDVLDMFEVIRPDDLAFVGQVIRERCIIRVGDVRAHPAWVSTDSTAHIHAYMGAPIVLGDDVLGVINLYSRERDFFTETYAEYLRVFAGQAALALRNARQYIRARELAALKERQRLARDLHDSVSQLLFSTSLMAESLPALARIDQQAVFEHLNDISRMTRGALAEMRTLLIELRPNALTEAQISDLLRQLATALAGRTEMEVKFWAMGGQQALPEQVKIAFYRVAQEAMNNIAKHASARTVTVTYEEGPQGATLSIVDDGSGFQSAPPAANHFGLGIMRERCEEIGGALQIVSNPGQGTEVRLTWPGEE